MQQHNTCKFNLWCDMVIERRKLDSAGTHRQWVNSYSNEEGSNLIQDFQNHSVHRNRGEPMWNCWLQTWFLKGYGLTSYCGDFKLDLQSGEILNRGREGHAHPHARGRQSLPCLSTSSSEIILLTYSYFFPPMFQRIASVWLDYSRCTSHRKLFTHIILFIVFSLRQEFLSVPFYRIPES